MNEMTFILSAFMRHADKVDVERRKVPAGRGGVHVERIVATVRRTEVEELRLVFDVNTFALVDSWAGTVNLNAEGAFHG